MNKQILSVAGALAMLAIAGVFFVLLGRVVPGQPSSAAAPTETVRVTPLPQDTSIPPTPTLVPQTDIPRYFTRAGSDQLPLQPFQLTPLPEETPTLTPGETFNLTVAEAEALAGYDILTPPEPFLPALDFAGASYDPVRHAVTQRFCIYDCGNGLTLGQYPVGNEPQCDLCGVVGAGAVVEEVQIGASVGEYVVGVWNLTEKGPVWAYESWLKSLRWQRGDTAFEIVYMGAPDTATKDSLTAWAASLQADVAGDDTGLEGAAAIQELSAQVGYPLKTLAALPTGYIFSRVDVHQPSNSVCLTYEYTGNDGPGPELWLAQGPIANAPGLVGQQDFTDARQTPVMVGGADEAFSLYGMQRNGEWACAQSEGGSNPALRLTWQAGGQQFDLYAMHGKCLGEEGLSDLDLLRLAEGITGVVSHAADELDLECTQHHLVTIEGLAGYFARLPRPSPGGMDLYGASYSGSPAKQIGLYLRLPDSNHTGLTILQMPVNPELGNDLASQYRDLPAGGYQLLTIAGDPAVMILGDWTIDEQGENIWYHAPNFAPTLWLESDGLLIAISGPWLVDGGGNPQEQVVAVAESMVYTDLPIAAAVSLAGFKPKLPSAIAPETFSRAGYDGKCTVYLFYNSKDSDKVDISQAPLACLTDSLYEFYQQPVWGGSVESATVMDHPAIYVQGCMDASGVRIKDCSGTQTLVWQADGFEYSIWSTLPDSSAKNMLTAIAESLADADLSTAGVSANLQNQPLRFFTRAERDVRPHEQLPWQLTLNPETPTPEPNLITNLTVAEAEQMAGFDVLGPVGMSRFIYFEEAVFDPQRNIVTIDYGNNFFLREERSQFSDGFIVGASAAVETVQIGAATGEYVEGVWQGTDCCGWVWEPTPFSKRLRWQASGIAFELTYNPTHDPDVVTMADMIAIAASVISTPSAVIEPSWLPEGYSYFTSSTADDGQTSCLYYRGRGDDEQFPSLVIVKSSKALPSLEQLIDPVINPADILLITDTVKVGGADGGQALFAETGSDMSRICGGERLPLDSALLWQANGLSFVLSARRDGWMGESIVTQLEMRRVAESMTGVSTIAANIVDPERLPSPQSAGELAGFTVAVPASVPDGYQFDHAAYWQDGMAHNVLLVYSGSSSSFGFSILQTSSITETLENLFMAAPEVYEKVAVYGQPALFSIGYCWDENNRPFHEGCGAPQSLTWFDNGMEYRIVGFFSKEAIIAIAESMR
jgi:hypothetical protein